MGGKKSKQDTANEEDQVSTLTYYVNSLDALKAWSTMSEEEKLQYGHLHITFKLAPKIANEIKRCFVPKNTAQVPPSGTIFKGRGIRKLTLTSQATGPLPSFREDILARVLKAICDLCVSLPKLEYVDLQGNFVGGRLDVAGKTPALEPTGGAVKVLCQCLRQIKQRESLKVLNLSLNNLSSAGRLQRSSGIVCKYLFSNDLKGPQGPRISIMR